MIAISLSIFAFALFIAGLSTAFENVIAQQDDDSSNELISSVWKKIDRRIYFVNLINYRK